MKVISVVCQVIGLVVVRRALPLPVIINDEVPRQTHQPVLQITLLSVVLLQRSINPDKNFLSQILCCVRSRRETVSEVVNSARVGVDNFLPCRAISCATPAN